MCNGIATSLTLLAMTGGQGHSVFPVLSLRAQRGNLVAVAMVISRRVFNLNEIATWFDRLTMSGCAPRNDNRKTLDRR